VSDGNVAFGKSGGVLHVVLTAAPHFTFVTHESC